MPEDNATSNTKLSTSLPPAGGVATDASADTADTSANIDADVSAGTTQVQTQDANIMMQVAQKIDKANNVLIALSSDPSVDEMAAAIGLSMYLDRLGKRATAIYSGTTPNALEFLKPDQTFENSIDSLRDFVIALNKEKADHLRYKLEGDYVRIFITPYKTKITESDLEFSYGDFNIDLVLALNVANGADLDAALREHGRIMHDAVIIDITTGDPGKLGEIEWSNKKASSVSEMVSELLYTVNSNVQIDVDEATAFLTGIVAATDRFKDTNTTPETMAVASKLMSSGANHQLISENITPDAENKPLDAQDAIPTDSSKGNSTDASDATTSDTDTDNASGADAKTSTTSDADTEEQDPSVMDIKHPAQADAGATDDKNTDDKASSNEAKSIDEKAEDSVTDQVPDKDQVVAPKESAESESSSIMDDLKAAEANLSTAATEVVPEVKQGPVDVDNLEDSALHTADDKAEISATPNPQPAESSHDTQPTEPPHDTPSTESSHDAQSAEVQSDVDTKSPELSSSSSSDTSSQPVDTSEKSSSTPADNATSPDSQDGPQGFISNKAEKVLQPPSGDIGNDQSSGIEVNKYGKMLEDALKSINGMSNDAPSANNGGLNSANTGAYQPAGGFPAGGNPAVMGAPAVPTNPEINGVPEINYMPMPGEEVLPPPPAPPIDTSSLPSVSDASNIAQPMIQSQPIDQSAFKIPGLGT